MASMPGPACHFSFLGLYLQGKSSSWVNHRSELQPTDRWLRESTELKFIHIYIYIYHFLNLLQIAE